MALLLLLVVRFSISTPVHAQPSNWDITYFSTEDGLSSNHVNCITKDSRGFIWVGTDNGLNRFDGYTFITLRLPSGALHPLSALKVLTVMEDSDSILWIGTSDGLFRYDPVNPLSDIRQYRYLEKPETHTYRFFQPVWEICEDKNGLFWLICMDPDEGVPGDIRTFDRVTETFRCIYPDSSFTLEEDDTVMRSIATQIYSDSRGDLWIGALTGLYRYDFETGSFERFIPFQESTKPYISWIIRIYEDRFGNFWTSGIYGLSLFDRENHTFGKHLPLEVKQTWREGFHSVVYAFGEDSSGHLWLRVNQSLMRLMHQQEGFPDPESIERYETDFTVVEINPEFSFYLESPWLVWLGVPDRGLCLVTVRRNVFRTIRPTSLNVSGVNDRDMVHSLYIGKDDRLWISNDGAETVANYDISNDRLNLYRIFPGESVDDMETDQNGDLWFASRYGNIARATVAGKGDISFTSYHPDLKNPAAMTPRHEIYAQRKGEASTHMWEHLFYKERDGTLWFNSGRGIHDRHDPETGGFIHLDHRNADYINNDTCPEPEVAGEIWFPSSEGLLRLLPPFTKSDAHTLIPGATILYRNVPGDENSLSSDWVRAIYYSRYYEPGTMWIATIRGGLNRMVTTPIDSSGRQEVHFRHYTTADGLCDNNVLGIIEDLRGYLWLSTMNGLSRFDPRTEQFHSFYRKDGLPTNNFGWADPAINSSGELFFPTETGVLWFHPDSIRINSDLPPVYITGFRIYNEPVYPGDKSPLKKEITETQSVELTYKQNFLSFEFAALNFENPERNHYKYLLEGFERDWTYSESRRYVEYRNLKPGNYTFRVQGSNNSGVWNEEGASLGIIIRNPPWQTWWAYVIYFLILSGLLLWYRRFLTNRERLKAAVEVERAEKEQITAIDAFRSRFFTNISHEFRTPLTLVAGPLEDSLKTDGETVPLGKNVLQSMLRNTRRLQRLINQLLDISRLEAGSMKLQVGAGPLPEFVRSIAGSFASLAEARSIDFTITAEGMDGECWYEADKIEKILSNLLSNAFKFTPDGGSITVQLKADVPQGPGDKRRAVLKVSDTGLGIARDHLARIFDRFYQVDSSDVRDREGTGIGLALTRELVHLMHGEITVESEPGRGTSFTVKFPVDRDSFNEEEMAVAGSSPGEPDQRIPAEVVPEAIEGVKDEAETEMQQTGMKAKDEREVIVVVEDNADLRHYIRCLLADNYTVEEAADGGAGLEKAIEIIPDLVISDIMMPVTDGMEMCKRLKAHHATSHIPVIMLTARADRESMIEGIDAAADDYIVKPFDSELMKARVRNLITQRRELRRSFEKQFLLEADQQETASPLFQMLREITKVFDKHLSEPDFNVEMLGKELNMSRSQLFRKVNAITGNTPMELLRMVRMKHAARLLRSGTMNISQVTYAIGLQNTSHFASAFRKYFGVSPSDYGKKEG
jgi:signal transduction histidine kinase/DNA-binding response OmpR family regulator/ligand-binding sensor domain-containing protein